MPTVQAELELTAKAAIGVEFTLLTPSNNFIGKFFMQKWEGYRNKFKATVKDVIPSSDGISATDSFRLHHNDRTTSVMPKPELVAALTSDAEEERLVSNPSWVLRSKLIGFRFVAFSSFMLDVHDQLGILSKSFQSNSLLIFDVPANINKTLRALKKLKETPGPNERQFWVEVRKIDGADMFHSAQLTDGVDGRTHFKSDRLQVLQSLDDHLIKRYQKVLDNNVLQSMSVFDQRFWPKSMDDCISQYDQKIEDLYIAFKGFYLESETLELVLEQWHDLQSRILGNAGLLNRRYHDLWPHMLIHFHKEYPLPLRLVVISLLVICDTSECERIFSLMNDIKTALRASLGSRTLRNLMLWHRMARVVEEDGTLGKEHLRCSDVPVMEIVAEFRKMVTGPNGRRPHRPFPVPKYEYEKQRT